MPIFDPIQVTNPNILGNVAAGMQVGNQFRLDQQQQEAAEKKKKDQAFKDRITSVTNAAVTASNLPDDESKVSFLTTRIADLGAQGIDTGDTQEVLDLFTAGKSDQANALIGSAVQTGRDLGILKGQAKQESGFTLGPGQTRFGAGGEVIAGLAPKSEDPNSLEQQKLLQRQTEQKFRQDQAEIKAGELSPTVQKILDASQTESIDAGQRSRSLSVLADDINKLSIGGGLASSTSETLKNLLGTQDDVSELRRRFNAVRASQSVQNLPPGPASDKDIQLALSGFPRENAGGQQIESFLRGAAKLENINAAFQSFKSNLISNSKSTKGMLKKWKSKELSPILGRDVSTSELFITAQEEGITIDDLKQKLGM